VSVELNATQTMKSALRRIKRHCAETNRRQRRTDPKSWAVMDCGAICIGSGDAAAHTELATMEQVREYLGE